MVSRHGGRCAGLEGRGAVERGGGGMGGKLVVACDNRAGRRKWALQSAMESNYAGSGGVAMAGARGLDFRQTHGQETEEQETEEKSAGRVR